MKWFLFWLALLPLGVLAEDFSLPGTGQFTSVGNKQGEINFGFAIENREHGRFFTVGQQKVKVFDIPEHYTFYLQWMQGSTVIINEFSPEPLKAFKYQLGEHSVEMKESGGKLILTVDKHRHYRFARPQAELIVRFNKKGILSIAVKGMQKITRKKS